MRRYLSQRALTAARACSELRDFAAPLPDSPPFLPADARFWLSGFEEELFCFGVAIFRQNDDEHADAINPGHTSGLLTQGAGLSHHFESLFLES
jgi:hypothetical protein